MASTIRAQILENARAYGRSAPAVVAAAQAAGVANERRPAGERTASKRTADQDGLRPLLERIWSELGELRAELRTRPDSVVDTSNLQLGLDSIRANFAALDRISAEQQVIVTGVENLQGLAELTIDAVRARDDHALTVQVQDLTAAVRAALAHRPPSVATTSDASRPTPAAAPPKIAIDDVQGMIDSLTSSF